MTIDSKLMQAILAMDSYNRGYNPGIVFGSDPNNSEALNGITKIGQATVFRSKGDDPAQDIGFYAIAYEYNEEVVVSYRGTDQFFTDSEQGVASNIIFDNMTLKSVNDNSLYLEEAA